MVNHVSIRYGERGWIDKTIDWYLREVRCDSEYGNTYLSHGIPIKYCPFCGEKLNE